MSFQLAHHRRLITVRVLRCGIDYEALTASFRLERKIRCFLLFFSLMDSRRTFHRVILPHTVDRR